jgi:aspartate-semialdehyde dehydrogenase
MEGAGMSVVVGRLRKDDCIGGVKFIVIGHNTIRGAAGCAILDAEYLKTQKYI